VALLCKVESRREVEVVVTDDIGNEAASSTTTSCKKTKDVKISVAGEADTINFTPLCEFEWADTAEVMGTLPMSPQPKVAPFKLLPLLPSANCPTPLPFRLLAVWRTG
jgi:hypothetical protein